MVDPVFGKRCLRYTKLLVLLAQSVFIGFPGIHHPRDVAGLAHPAPSLHMTKAVPPVHSSKVGDCRLAGFELNREPCLACHAKAAT